MKNRGLAKIPMVMNGMKVKLRRIKDIELDLNNSLYIVKVLRLIIVSYDIIKQNVMIVYLVFQTNKTFSIQSL